MFREFVGVETGFDVTKDTKNNKKNETENCDQQNAVSVFCRAIF